MENKTKEFIKPISIVGKEWSKGSIDESQFFQKNKNELVATYSDEELATFNALFYTIQKNPLMYSEITNEYTEGANEEDLISKWLVIKEADLKDLIKVTSRNKKSIDKQTEIEKYLKTDNVTLMDSYLYGLKSKTIVTQGVWKPKLRVKAEIAMYSVIGDIEKFKIGRENVYHIRAGEIFKLATTEYKMALTVNTNEQKAHGRYIKHTTGRKSLGKYAELIIEYLKTHEWKKNYTAPFDEIRIALNLPEYEKTKRVTLSRVVDKIRSNEIKIKSEINFSYEVHKKDNKITFNFGQPSLF